MGWIKRLKQWWRHRRVLRMMRRLGKYAEGELGFRVD